MNRALWIAKTAVDAQQTRMSVVSNNLANVSTTGFKKDRAVFADLIYQNVRQVGSQSSESSQLPSGLRLGTGVRVVATEKMHTQGNPISTENAYDMAIEGRGFLQILMPDGTVAYTRDGSFNVSADGQLVTSDGYPLEPSITVPDNMTPGSFAVGRDGMVTAMVDNAQQTLGNIQLADFTNPQGLQAIGQNLFLESPASGTPQTVTPGLQGAGMLVQGSLEASNVNVVEEMVNMIETQRAYEMGSKAISTADQMLSYVTQQL
ncbi:flagellar basal-body rod protein FlgG [Endothiovibrio diazotrophicus]